MREEMGEWRFCLVFLLAIVTSTAASGCPQDSPDRNLLCYQTKFTEEELEPCLCTHWVLTRELLDEKDYLVERNEDLQIILSVETGETNLTQEIFHEGVQGIELSTLWTKTPKQLVKYVKSIVEELHQSSSDLSRSKRSYSVRENEPTTEEDDLSTVVTDSEIVKSTVNTARDTASSTETVLSLEDADNNLFGDRSARDDSDQKLMLIMRLPSNAMFLAKHYDLKGLARYVDLFVLNTDNIVETRANVTYHPSRLMGINDIHNADSLVDLITGLGIPKDKLVLAFPTHAYQFQLANASLSLPQSPALGAPKLLTQAQLCKLTKQGNWTTERDEDLTAPYTFQNNTWIAFDDEMSASIKSKYIALSNLAGAAIMDIQDQDWSHQCGGKKGQAPALVRTLYDTFTQVIRKPRQTQLLELQQQLHEHSMDAPTRVVRVVDHEGATHVVRRDVVVNFQCSRQGYFVHPTGCNRFYRCVKFNQYTDDWTVFEYDCPAGLAFDERWEVCVWPGSLPDGGACQGSSEIAPVPRNRFQCPAQPGYYADPENCRWFFACLDHAGDGVTPLTAYEFRCPFSLVFNEQTLVCDWPWNVQGCGSQGVGGARFTYGDLLEGRHKPSYATVPDYLVSGGRIENSGGTGGSILGTYYGSNGVLDINAAGGYPSESQQVYGSKSAGGRLSSSVGGLYSGDRGSTTSGSNQYGNYAKTAQTGSGGYGVFGPAGSGYIQGAGAYVADNEGAYVHGQYPGDSGDDGSYREGQYGNGGLYVSGEYGYKTGSEGAYAGSSGGRYSGSSSAGGKYSGSRVSGGQYSGSSIAGGKYSGSSVTGGSYAGSNGQYGKGEQYSGSDEAGYVSRGEYSANGPGKYFGAAAGYNQGVPSSTPYAGLSGQYDAGKYSAGSGEYVSSADQYSGGQYSGSSQYSGAKLYTGSPVVSTTATPFVSTQYSTAGLYSGAKYTGSPLPVSTTISPFLSTQAGQYTLSNGLTYSGPSVAPTFAASKSVLHHSSASVGTASTLASTTASPYSDGVVSSTTPGYSGVGGVYSGVSLSGEKFGVDGESGHIHSPFKVNNGFEQYTGGFDNIAYQVNSLQPSLSENVDGNGYSTSGKVFFSPTPTPGGFSSYTPSSYGTSTPNPFYGSSTSLPGVFSSLYPGKSYVSTTPAPVPYSSFSSAKSTTATPVVASYSTPRPVSYGGASYSTTPAPVVSYSSTPAPFSPSYSPSVASYSPSPIPYSPSVGSYSPSPAPYSPSVISYSSTPAPYAPSGIPYSPSVISYPSKSAPYSPSGSHYSPSPAPYSPSTVSYSTTPAPVVSYSSTPAPYSPSVVSYSSTPAPYPSYSPSVGSYSSGARYSPSVSSYSPTPAPYSPSVTSYSTPAPVASYSPSPSPVSFASYPSPKPVAYTPGSKVYAPSSTVAPAIVSYSTPAPKTYYPTSTPVPIVQYSSIAPPLYSGSLTGFPGHSQYTGGQAYVSGYAGPSFSQGYESQQYSGSYSAGSSEYNAGASAGKVQYGRKSPISYSTTTEKGSYASPSAAPAAYSTTVSPINTYSAGSNVYSGSDYSSGSRYQNYVQSNVGYSASQAYSGDEYLPPLESVPAYDVKKPCDHPAAPVPSAYAPAPAIPYQTFLSSGYEQVKYQTPYVFESSTPAPPDYNRQSFQFRPIVVQPLPEVSSFKDYFYSSVLPSSYSTPAPIAYSTTPAYISTVSPIQYSIPIKTYVSSTPAPPTAEYQYVSSYSTPKPFVSTTASPIYENSYVSSYSTPKPVSYTPAPVASTTSRPIVDYSFGSTYTPRPVTYAPTPYVSTTAAPIIYSTTASPVSYAATFESAKVYPTGPPSVPLSFASYSSPPVVYGPGNLQPIRTYQSTGSYDVQSYTATPKPCASNALDIADESKAAGAENLPDGTYVVGIKHQDKVVIVSRLSDFNPLLVEKLGATCDCQAQSQPIKVLRRRKILKSTTASPNELGSSGQYNSNSIETYNAHKIETASPDVDVVSYNTQAEAEKSEQFHASPKVTSKKIYSAKKSSVTSTTEKSYESSEDKHSHDDKLSITEFGTIECKRAGLFRHPKHCNKFYQCNWDEWKKKYTLHEFKCPIHLAYDSNIGACNWPSKGPACSNDNLLV